MMSMETELNELKIQINKIKKKVKNLRRYL